MYQDPGQECEQKLPLYDRDHCSGRAAIINSNERMWPTAHIPPHQFRPRPYCPKTRTTQAVDSTQAIEKVELQLDRSQGNARPEELVITVGEIMQTEVLAVPPSLSLEELGRLFMEKKVSGFPVVDSAGTLLGLVSQKDLLTSVVESQRPAESSFYTMLFMETPQSFSVMPGGRVEDIMTPYIYFATPDTDIKEVISMMLERSIHRVVVTEQGRLRGMVTTSQLLRVLSQLL